MSRFASAVPPFRHLNVPELDTKSTLSSSSHTSLASSTLPSPSTSTFSTQKLSLSEGLLAVETLALPTPTVVVVLAVAGGVGAEPTVFETADGLTTGPVA